MKKVNITDIAYKINFIDGDECEKNKVGIIIYSDGNNYFFDSIFRHKIEGEELKELLIRGAVIEKDGNYYKPSSFNEEKVSLSDVVINPEDIEVDLSDYATKEYVDSKLPDDIQNVYMKTNNLYDIELTSKYYNCSYNDRIISTNNIPSNGLFCIDCNVNNIGNGKINLKAGIYYFRVKVKSTKCNYFNQFRICDSSGQYVRMTKIDGTIGLDVYDELVYSFELLNDYNNIGFLVQSGSPDSVFELKDFMISTEPIEYTPYNIKMVDMETINAYNINQTLLKRNNLCVDNWFGNSMKYIATSGKCGNSQTNTVEAIRQSAHCGYDGVEVDVRITKDNKIVCYHNKCTDDLLNTTGGHNIYEYTLDELKTYKYNSEWISNYYEYDLTLMTLDEAISMCRKFDLMLFLDIKTDEYEKSIYHIYVDSIIDILVKYNYHNNTVFVTSDFDIIDYIRSIIPEAIISYKMYISNNGVQKTTVENDLYYLTKIGGKVIAQCEDNTLYEVPDTILTDDRIRRYHAFGFPVKGFDFKFTEDIYIDKIKRDQIIYKTKINSQDHGATWRELDDILGISIVDYNDGAGILLKLGVLDHLLMMTCNPTIMLDTGVDKKLQLSAAYSPSDKGIVISGVYENSNFINNIPNTYQNVSVIIIF